MTIAWTTPSGSLGTFKESEFLSIPLLAVDSDSYSLEYSHISGTMPPGTRVETNGLIQGIPVILTETPNKTTVYSFTVRANNPVGTVADRTFNIRVTNYSSLKIADGVVDAWCYDNDQFIYQFSAVTDNPNAVLSWSLDGNVPNDARTGLPIEINSSGKIESWMARFIDQFSGTEGYEMEPGESFPYDFEPRSTTKMYDFFVQVTDGVNVDRIPVHLFVLSASILTADNTNPVNAIEPWYQFTADRMPAWAPIITSDTSLIPVLTSEQNYAFQFEAIDPLGDVVWWRANSSIPSGLTIGTFTGWLTGTIPSQVDETVTYTFGVIAYKRDYTEIESLVKTVTITVVRDGTNYITWNTAGYLGTAINGSPSEFYVEAYNNSGKTITYTHVGGLLPPGTRLDSTTGLIEGRLSFQYFSLDGTSSTITVANTYGVVSGMTVTGPGVASGCSVTEVINSTSLVIQPALHISAGVDVTFVDTMTLDNVTTQITDLSTTTEIDSGSTTFDCTFTFNVNAAAYDGATLSVSNVQECSILVNNFNRAPYTNAYVKALPIQEHRDIFEEIMSDPDVWENELIYRGSDAWFGKSTGIKMLFLPGMAPSTLSNFANAIQRNHYVKQLNFGEIRTARAVDEAFNTKYEVVYVEILDNKQVNGVSTAISSEPAISQPYLYGDESYTTIYPNSYTNMQTRIEANIGYTNRGALPDWMTSPQEDGTVLGLVRCVILAYTIPGAAKKIAYRLKNKGYTFSNINFEADRYNLDVGMLTNYDLENNIFYSGQTDTYLDPEQGDKYIRFPQIGVYR